MTLPLAILWIALISLVALGGAWYARKHDRYDALLVIFVTLVIVANLIASKTVAFDLGFTVLYAPAAVLIFSVTFLLTDIVNEKFGRQETQKMIFLAFIAQVIFALFTYLAISMQGAPFFDGQSAFETVLGSVPRIALAGWVAFLISENLDAYLFAWFKKVTGGKHLWMRNAFSSLPAMLVDSVLFVTLAFYGVMPILPLIIGLTVMKWLVGIIDIPFMYASRAVLRK